MTCPELCTLDIDLPEKEDLSETTSYDSIDTSKLPFPVHHLSSEITNLLECARHQIQCIEEELEHGSTDNTDFSHLQDALDDGFFLCDLSVIQQKLQRWHTLFPRIKPFFAVKCNPNIMVASVLGQHARNCGFDCASLSEILLALQCTSDSPSRILYANPQRAELDLEQALRLGVRAMTFDDAAELHKIHKAYHDFEKSCLGSSANTTSHDVELVLRIVVPDGSSTVPLGEKFGASLPKVDSLTREAMELDMRIVGISFHCGSGNHDPYAYEQAIYLARDAMDIVNSVQGGSTCRLLDIGGGFPGLDGSEKHGGRFMGACSERQTEEPSKLADDGTAAAIAKVVTPLVDELFPSDVHVISEPGRYFAQAAFAICSRIYSVRVESDANIVHYYIAQGVQGVFKDTILCGERFVPQPLTMNIETTTSTPQLCRAMVHGPSGEEYDIVCRDISLPLLQVGDWLVFDRMGAYTISIATRSGSQPIRYVLS